MTNNYAYLDDNKSHGSRYELEEKENDRKDDDDEDKEEDKKPEEKPEEPEEESIFSDVAIDDPNYDAIVKVFEKGWMVGVSDVVFAPNGTLTRGMAATILWNKAGKPEPVNAAPFLDVTADAWYAKAVAWAYEQGIVLGLKIGRSRIEAAKNPNVIKNEISAEIKPFENAVNIDEANILNPAIRKFNANKCHPLFVICQTVPPCSANIPIIGSFNIMLKANQRIELKNINTRLIFISFFKDGMS